MNKHEAETAQLDILVKKGHPYLAIVHQVLRSNAVQTCVVLCVAKMVNFDQQALSGISALAKLLS